MNMSIEELHKKGIDNVIIDLVKRVEELELRLRAKSRR